MLILASTKIYAINQSNKTHMGNGLKNQPVLDEELNQTQPRNFRYQFTELRKSAHQQPSLVGLSDMPFAGSAQFSEKTLLSAVKKLSSAKLSSDKLAPQVWIIDLRRENHGFVNGLPISWFAPQNQSNVLLTKAEILAKEKRLLADIPLGPFTVYQITSKASGRVIESKPINITVSQVETEQQLAERLGFGYFRLPGSDHQKPPLAEVDQFIKMVRQLSKAVTLYFHCRAGKGRTTTYLSMLDMLKNARQVSLNDILLRQYLLGGSDLTDISDAPADEWKKQWALERLDFLTSFYEYAQSANYHELTYSEWLEQKPQKKQNVSLAFF